MNNVKTRVQIANEEITVNPIFILLRGTTNVINPDDWDYNQDTEILTNKYSEKEYNEEEALKNDEAKTEWFPQYVFFTREEAESYVKYKSHHYNYGNPRKNIDYLIYCVPAMRSLIKQLGK